MAELNGTVGPDTIDGTADADTINGREGDDVLRGNAGNDRIIAGLGYDLLLGGAGDDELYFGNDFTTADYAGGGEGNDKLLLQGDYAAILMLGAGQLFDVERLELLSGSDTRFGDTAGNLYSYNLRMADANVSPGRSMHVDFRLLGPEEHVIFGARDETSSAYIVYGGLGDDTIATGAGNDTFYFDAGRWGKDDSVDGGSGDDHLSLQGTAGNNFFSFGANQIIGIESLSLRSANESQNWITLRDANVAAGQTLSIGLEGGGRLIFNGSEETDGNLSVSGGIANDVIMAGRGNDSLYGLDDLDEFWFGAWFTNQDRVDGGRGGDTVYLQGNYAGAFVLEPGALTSVERLVLMSGSETRFGDLSGALYSYDLRLSDGVAPAGGTFTVDFSALYSEEHVIFGARAVTNSNLKILGGFGDDTIAGGALNDTFQFGAGRWGKDDSVNGEAGSDLLSLELAAGNNALAFAGNQLFSIEKIELRGLGSGLHTVTVHDNNALAGESLTIQAIFFGTDRLFFDGSAETDARLVVTGGAGADTIIGGGSGDTLNAGANDTLIWNSVLDSDPADPDTVTWVKNSSKLDLSRIDANTLLAGDQAFRFIGNAAFSGQAGQLRFGQSPDTPYTPHKETVWPYWIQADIDGDAVSDFDLRFTFMSFSPNFTMSANDFVL